MKITRLQSLIENCGLELAELAALSGVSEIRLIQLSDPRTLEANLRLKTLMRLLGVIAVKSGRPIKELLTEVLGEDFEA